MASIFAPGQVPQQGPLPIEADSQQPIRNFLSGFQMAQQKAELDLKTKEVASQIVHQNLQNQVQQHLLDQQAAAEKYFSENVPISLACI
jgi:hypothetical protein